jgi:cold-inducible RNA-binding protein
MATQLATKLYVGSLSFNITEDQLKELFETAGTVVSASIITDRDTNHSKGFGFVEMGTEQEAQNAITTLNGKEIDGRTIVVNIARPKEDRPSRPTSFNNRRRY